MYLGWGLFFKRKTFNAVLAPERINTELFIYDNPSPIQLDSNLSR